MSEDNTEAPASNFHITSRNNLTPEERLNTTAELRMDLLREFFADGKPTGKEVRQAMDLMNDSDNQALTMIKLEQEKQSSNESNDIARESIAILRDLGVKVKTADATTTDTPELDSNALPEVELLDGEMSTEVSSQTHEEFVAALEQQET